MQAARQNGHHMKANDLHPNDIKVLLVDDEQLSRCVVGNLLRKCGYMVTVCDSGANALDIIKRSVPGTFQLILTVRGRCPLLGTAPAWSMNVLHVVQAYIHLYWLIFAGCDDAWGGWHGYLALCEVQHPACGPACNQ